MKNHENQDPFSPKEKDSKLKLAQHLFLDKFAQKLSTEPVDYQMIIDGLHETGIFN